MQIKKLEALSPIALFVYNRPIHTKKTLLALQRNTLAKDSALFIFSDGPKSVKDNSDVKKVRRLIKNVQGFKTVTIIEKSTNCGLAQSIIKGVTELVNKFGSVIVLEDDIVTSPFFLEFMNLALYTYRTNTEVWHISGWNYPIETNDLPDAFFWRGMNCWGWATWDNRWKYFTKNTDELLSEMTSREIRQLNLDNANNFFSQVRDNKSGKINTWAIYWYITIFRKQGLCLNPAKSYVKNIGIDGSGINSGSFDVFGLPLDELQNKLPKLALKIEENKLALKRIQNFYKKLRKSLVNRILTKIKFMLIHFFMRKKH